VSLLAADSRMIRQRMNRLSRIILIAVAALAVAAVVSACGTQKVQVPKSDPTYTADQTAADIFNQRCGGCHTLSYAGTSGSGQNPRDYLNISGPNFNQRCERPADRVLYAIENGGFSGAYMPQNIVVGKQAIEVANFVAKYAGGQAPAEPGATPCQSQPLNPVSSASSSSSSGS